MVTNETLLHKNPKTGKPQVIGLGWLDDSMTPHGPTEEDKNYIADTGVTQADVNTQVAAYKASMVALIKKVVPMGGYWWQLMDGGGNKLAGKKVAAAQCEATLKQMCVDKPPAWNRMTMFNIPHGGKGLKQPQLLDYTAEFLLTRGPYAMLGYSWYGCTGSAAAGGGASPDPPRATQWDMDLGVPAGACKSAGGGKFTRSYSKATVGWDCAAGHGTVTVK